MENDIEKDLQAEIDSLKRENEILQEEVENDVKAHSDLIIKNQELEQENEKLKKENEKLQQDTKEMEGIIMEIADGERWIVGVFQALKSETRIFGILDTFYNGNFGTLKPNEIFDSYRMSVKNNKVIWGLSARNKFSSNIITLYCYDDLMLVVQRAISQGDDFCYE